MRQQIQRMWGLGQLAKDMASLKCRKTPESSAQARQKMIQRLGSLHGLPQKLGQVLSLTELTGEEQSYTVLTEGPPVLSWAEVSDQIERALGRPWTDVYRELDQQGIAASLAQVHSGLLHDGQKVAVKVQYPGMVDSVKLDLKALGWLTAPVGDLRRGFDLAGYRREVGEMLNGELNLQQEARNLRDFGHHFRACEWLEVPEVIDRASNDRVLTMSWIEGEPFSEVRKWTVRDQQAVAERLLRLFLMQCFGWHQIHADPHPGNYRFRIQQGSPAIGLLDFGCVKVLEEDFAEGLKQMAKMSMQNRFDDGEIFSCFVRMGFSSKLLEPMKERLADLTRVLFAPFRVAEFSISEWNLSERVSEILGEHRLNFRIAGPPDLIYFIRAYQGAVQYLKALGHSLSWRDLAEDVLGGFEWEENRALWPTAKEDPSPARAAETLSTEAQLSKALAPAKAGGRSSLNHDRVTMKSDELHIQVQDQGQTTVKLTFGAGAVDCLVDLVPADLKSKLATRSIDLANITSTAVANDYAPGELFQLTDGPKQVRVWLQ